jgi:hypothetical protein
MPRYRVPVECTYAANAYVEAKTAEEAMEKVDQGDWLELNRVGYIDTQLDGLPEECE